MPVRSLKAHFDGTTILLDEPFEIPPNSPLLVTLLPIPEADAGFLVAAERSLADAYAENEPEYALEDVKR